MQSSTQLRPHLHISSLLFDGEALALRDLHPVPEVHWLATPLPLDVCCCGQAGACTLTLSTSVLHCQA